MSGSLADRVLALPPGKRKKWFAKLDQRAQQQIVMGLAWWFYGRPEQFEPPGTWRWHLVVAGRGFGKDLSLNTPIPTPSGWTTMGAVQPGDVIFDETGAPTTVLATFDTDPERCWRLHFSDGTSIDAGEGHQWVTWTHAERKAYLRSPYEDPSRFPDNWPAWRLKRKHSRHQQPKVEADSPGPQVRTTQQIVDTLTFGARGDTNHCIPTAGPLQLPDADLPVDPWTLGYWLGNGNTGRSQVCCHADDETWVRESLAAGGYEVGPTPTARPESAPAFTVYGLITELRALGVADDKHVPPVYLRGSERQRAALLAGLIDSDGYMDPVSSQVEFCSTLECLADAALELARSLGQKPVKSKGRATLNGIDYGPKWRVTWRPTTNPFRSPRKRAAYTPPGGQSLRNHHRMIVRAEEIPPTPMRCLTVDSPHELFLAGEGMIPTHNTRMGAEWCAEKARRYPGARIALVAPSYGEARDTMVEGVSGLLSVLHPSELQGGGVESAWNRSMGELFLANGSRFKVFSSERPRQLRGPNHHFCWADEAPYFSDAALGTAKDSTFSNLNFGLRLPPRPGWDRDYRPRGMLTCTPRRVPLLKVADDLAREKPYLAGLLQRPPSEVAVTRGSTMDNMENLDATYRAAVIDPLIGTTLGQQELGGIMLEDVEGALWKQTLIDATRVMEAPPFDKVAVAYDPAGGGGPGHDEHGIVAGGSVGTRNEIDIYITHDASFNGTPVEAAKRTLRLAVAVGADRIVYEKNQGQDWIPATFESTWAEMVSPRDGREPEYPGGMLMPRMEAVSATRSKEYRATFAANIFEQKRGHIVGSLPILEGQMTTWVPNEGLPSPDRVDASVWLATALYGSGPSRADVASSAGRDRRGSQLGRRPARAVLPPTAGGRR